MEHKVYNKIRAYCLTTCDHHSIQSLKFILAFDRTVRTGFHYTVSISITTVHSVVQNTKPYIDYCLISSSHGNRLPALIPVGDRISLALCLRPYVLGLMS